MRYLDVWKKKRQNAAKKGMGDRQASLKRIRKTKNCSIYDEIKEPKEILLIYIDYINCAGFLVISFYFYHV